MILDTNTFGPLQDARPELVSAISGHSMLVVPLNMVAELKAGYLRGSRTEQNERILNAFLSLPQVEVLVPTVATAAYYAELQALCWHKGRALSQNDIWIAALAYESGDNLITYDKDFEVFRDVFGEKLIIL